MRRRIVIHNHLPARTRDAEPRPGDPDYKRWVEQQREDQNKRGGKFQADRHDWGKRDSVGVVNREDEERNRDKLYRDAGISRDGGPGSGPQKGGGNKAPVPEAKGWAHLPPATQKKLEGIQSKIHALEAQPWSEKLDKEHAALMKQRHELGWKNPWIEGIVGGLIGGRRNRR